MKKQVTLKEYVKRIGSQEKAAHSIGISFATLNRWLRGHAKPSDLAAKQLKILGIKVADRASV